LSTRITGPPSRRLSRSVSRTRRLQSARRGLAPKASKKRLRSETAIAIRARPRSAARLARSVDGALAGQGFAPEERPFSGHVTLGRVREPGRDRHLASALAAGAGHRFGRLTVDRFALMRSELSPRGARYSIIAAWPLSASPSQGTTAAAR